MRSILKLGSGVPYLNTFLLDLFLKGTTIKYKSILFSPWFLLSPEKFELFWAWLLKNRGFGSPYRRPT